MAEQNSRDDQKCVTGDLKNFNIFDITQSLMMSRKTALVTVISGTKRGFVYFKEGQITSALDDGLATGEQAAFKIFHWRGGTFRIDFDAPPRERNVKLDTENLMLEVARHMDETQRQDKIEGKSDQNAVTEVEEKFEDKFRNQLHRVFKEVASTTTPARDRYSVRAFDALLVALNDLAGSALFLRPDTRPRVKTTQGFETIKQEIIAANEIEGFLNALLSARERERFAETKEITVYHSTQQAGTFQVSAFYDGGRPACIFTPASKTIPSVTKLGGDAAHCVEMLAKKTGLILVAGPMPGGKSTFVASLVEEGLKNHDFLATIFARHHIYAFTDECGFIIRADATRFSFGEDGSLEQALHQGADLVAVDEVLNPSMFRDAVTVAANKTLVVAALEADDLDDLAERLDRLAQGSRAERIYRQLAQSLSGVLFVDLAETGGRSPVKLCPIGDDARQAIARGGAEAFAFLRAPALVG